jgi:hypothetical protein
MGCVIKTSPSHLDDPTNGREWARGDGGQDRNRPLAADEHDPVIADEGQAPAAAAIRIPSRAREPFRLFSLN